jgi:hypothetical protein
MSLAVWSSPTPVLSGIVTIADAVDAADASASLAAPMRVGRSETAGLLCCLCGVLVAAFIQIVAQPMLPTGPLNPPVISGYAAR